MADADVRIKVATDPKNPFASITDDLDKLDAKIGGITGGFAKAAGALAGVAALKGAFDFVLDATREMETLQTQFIAFTGSASGAADQMQRLTEFASKSPFALAEVAEANRTLLAFGSSTGESVEQLRQLGEVSAATGAGLKDIAVIFGQIQAEGKLTGERFNQLVEKGVNLGPVIAQSMGIAESSIKKFVSEGKVGADVVSAAFQKMTSEGGQFFGSTERLAGTVSGSISSLEDNIKILASTVGGSAVPAFTGLVNIISKAVEGNIAYLKEQQKIANENEAQKRIRAIGEEVQGLTEELEELKKTRSEGFKFFGDDQLQLADKIDTVTFSIRNLSLERLKLLKQDGMSETLKKDAEAATELEKKNNKAAEKAKADAKTAADELAAQAAKTEAERIKKIQDTERQITDISVQEQQVRSAKKDLLRQQEVEREAEADQKRLADALLRGDAAAVAEETRRIEQNEKRRIQEVEALTARETELTTAKVTAEATKLELMGQFADAEVARQQDTQRKLTDAQKKGEAERMAAIRKAQAEEFNIAHQTSTAMKNFDEQTYAQKVATAQAGMNALSGLMRSKNREAFEIGKAAATAQALVAIPTTAIEAYKSLAGIPVVGPALGAAAAAAAVYSGMEQVRQIQSTRLAMNEGGIVPGAGNRDTVPALLTPGEVVVPKNNFGDLQNAFMRDAIASDQVALLQAGNNIQAKILDTLQFGVINEKLTTMIVVLENIKNGISTISTGSALPGEIVDKVDAAQQELERNAADRADREAARKANQGRGQAGPGEGRYIER